MPDSLILSQSKLDTFLICRRRFQLRYLRRLPWPDPPLGDDSAEVLARGQQFHQVMERHFLGLDVAPEEIADGRVRHWWRQFRASGLALPDGRFLPEHRLTVPLDDHLLLGRFDLLVVSQVEDRPFAHIFDWKTGKARPEAELRQDWQTRLYLALAAEGGGALWPNGRSLSPDNVAITYWYATEPDQPRTIRYSAAWHQGNWAEIQALSGQIDAALAAEAWPLTDDWSACRVCAYQVYCGRQAAGEAAPPVPEADEAVEEDWSSLEPQSP
ncbi:MAG: PD-(D/E)XK nuclease family protein [Ardenticatenaceae bacterium]|nr:PD-(D/E)XK nuclease family protein [Ardenticatenaceae bacterium]